MEAKSGEHPLSFLISIDLMLMNVSINFHNQRCLWSVEVDDIVVNWMLAAKFKKEDHFRLERPFHP